MTNIRKLKIYSKYQRRECGGGVTIPEIRLEGKWLNELGFKKGQVVVIQQEQNKLTITVDSEAEITTPNTGYGDNFSFAPSRASRGQIVD
jgi:toxic protein SymE